MYNKLPSRNRRQPHQNSAERKISPGNKQQGYLRGKAAVIPEEYQRSLQKETSDEGPMLREPNHYGALVSYSGAFLEIYHQAKFCPPEGYGDAIEIHHRG